MKRSHDEISGMLQCGSSLSQLAKFLQVIDKGTHDECAIGTKYQQVKASVNDSVHQYDGKHGPILQRVDLNLADGGTYTWEYVSPFTLLGSGCDRSLNFHKLMESRLSNCGELVIFADGFVPGNPLRSEKGRKMQGIYWNTWNLPEWWRSRHNGWFFFGCLQTKVIDKLKGGMSGVMRSILNIFFGEHSFNSDVGVHMHHENNSFIIRMERVDTLLHDLKGFQETWNWVGCGGTMMCLVCSNVFQQHREKELVFPAGAGMILYNEAKWKHCRLHTKETIWNTTAVLDTKITKAGKCPRKYEQSHGFRWEPAGLLWDIRLRKYVDPVHSTFYDSQHYLFSSGGIAQFHVNEFLRHLISEGVSLAQLDAFAADVRWPSRLSCAGRKDMMSRVYQKDADGHCKGSAADVVTVVDVLSMFVHMVLLPSGKAREHAKCLVLLKLVTDIVMAGEAAVRFADKLRTLVDQYFDMFCLLYGQHVRPKLHALLHLSEMMLRKRKNPTCWQCERFHRQVKQWAANAFGKHPERYINKRMIISFFEALKLPETFLPEYIHKPRAVPRSQIQLVTATFELHGEVWFGTGASTMIGVIRNGDLVCVRRVGAVLVGRLQLCVSGYPLTHNATSQVVKCLLQMCSPVRENIWADTNEMCVFMVSDILAALPHVDVAEGHWIASSSVVM